MVLLHNSNMPRCITNKLNKGATMTSVRKFAYPLSRLSLCCALLAPFSAWAATTGCDPTQFGARGDGQTVNTQALQQAIDQCSQQGGGTVELGEGVWLSGPLQLRNDVTLQLADGSVLQATNVNKDFVAAFIGAPAQAGEAFILANGVSNVAITGTGTVDGNGAQDWWPEAMMVRKRVRGGDTDYFKQRFPGVPLANGMPRPWLIEFNNTQNARIGGILATNSPMWNIVIRNSEQVELNGTRVINPEDSPNSDGVDIVSSRHVTLSHLDIDTGDDNVAIKSGLPGLKTTTQPSQDIVVTRSIMRRGHGISIGSETANGIRNISVSHVRFYGTENGVRVKSARDRGADIGPITASHLQMENVITPILITESYSGQSGIGDGKISALDSAPISPTTPYIHDVTVEYLTATGAKNAGFLSGLPEAPLKQITLHQVNIDASEQGLLTRYVEAAIRSSKISNQAGDGVVSGPEASLQMLN